MAKMSFAQRVKQRAKEAEFSGGSNTLKLKEGVQFFKPKKGKNEIMIIPFVMDVPKNQDNADVGELWFRLPEYTHYNVGAEGKSVICPKTIGKKCPICEHRAALLSQGRATDDPEVRDITPRKRELYWVIDLEDAENESPKVFEASYHNFGKKLEEEIRESDDDSLAANFADPNDGAVITVRMTEETFGKNKYLEAARFDFAERNKREKAIVKNALDEVTPFGEMLVVLPYDELKNLFYDITDESNSDAEFDDDNPFDAPKAKQDKDSKHDKVTESDEDDEEEKPKSKKRPVEDDDEDNIFGSEDEPPAKSKRKPESGEDEKEPVRRKKPVKQEEDEEEDDPAPVRKKVSKESLQKCPGGGKFGKDCDDLEDCEDCAIWADCDKAKNG